MESMIDKLKQVEDKMLLNRLYEADKWVYVFSKEPVLEACITNAGNYSIIITFNHVNADILYKKIQVQNNSATHVLTGDYEIVTDYMTIAIEKSPSYYSLQSGATICFKSMKDVSAVVSLEEGKIDLSGIVEGEKEKARKKTILLWFMEYYRGRKEVQQVFAVKNDIKRGDYIKISEAKLDVATRKKFAEYIGDKGFVIKIENGIVDVRFGSERLEISKNLVELAPVTKTEDKTIAKTDRMNPGLWMG